MGKLVRVISNDGAVLATALDSTDMVYRAERIHESSATVTAATGRMLTAASMMGAALKNDNDTITLRISGNGPAGPITAVSDARGNAKVTVMNPIVEIPLNDKGKLDVSGAVGKDGFLSVVRDSGKGEPQSGYCPIITGEIGEDVTNYFVVSEQIPTVCALGVLVSPDLTVAAAGGYLIQLLPGADDSCIDKIESNISDIPPVSSMIKDKMTPEMILERVLDGFELEVIEEIDVEYRCDCSKDRAVRAIISLGNEELTKIASEQDITTVECHFCENNYTFTAQELLELCNKD